MAAAKGDYAVVYNRFDNAYEHVFSQFKVVEAPDVDEPFIASVYVSASYFMYYDGDVSVTANGYGGTEPYRFRFTLDNGAETQDFSANNQFLITVLEKDDYKVYAHGYHRLTLH